ncbi:MAG TPA: phosphoesterase, partial [Vicinamibacteria bacterium]|nr:phosphoesterase [Vicinamibacteria bacterium]
MGRLSPSTILLPLTLLFLPSSAVARTDIERRSDDTVLRWNNALLQAVRNVRSNPVVTARALAVVHTAMYDAWAAYDREAIGTRTGDSLRRPRSERTPENKRVAVSYAAYRALADLFPTETAALFDPLLLDLGLDPADTSTDAATPAGVGNAAAAAVIAFRHADGSNQLGDINGGAPYSDYTGCEPVNTPASHNDPNRWQPLATPTGPQVFLAPHWEKVIPFALKSASEVRPGPPAKYPGFRYRAQAKALVRLSAGLSDREKMIAEYWADGPATETPPGHWNL